MAAFHGSAIGKFGSLNRRLMHDSFLGRWVVAGVAIGVIAGIGATLFLYLIQYVTNYFLGGITGYFPPNPAGESPAPPTTHPVFLLVPLVAGLGGLIAGVIIYKFAPEAEGHGTDAAIDAFHRKNGVVRKRIPLVKAIASAFTIGSGGSAGREGPTAQIAAGFGSLVGSLLHFSAKDRRIAVAVGIGAGIGTIFKTPFGGAILSAEILYSGGDFEAETLIPGFIAAPVGYVIFASIVGFTPIFGNSFSYNFTEPRNLIIYAAAGVLCGFVAKLYTTSFYGIKHFFDRLKTPKYIRPAIGAAAAGVIAVFFPEVIGLGYGYLQFLVNGQLRLITSNYVALPLAAIIVLVILLKILATSLTVGSGGSGGVFAPSLVIGGFLGAGLWEASRVVLPGWIPIPGPLVIVSMMALFAGAGRVPIAVVLMVSEMTGSLTLLAPAMVSVVLSYYIAGPKYSIYKSQALTRMDSPAHFAEYRTPLMARIHVMDAMSPHVITLTSQDNVETAQKLMLERQIKGIPVVDGLNLVGMITLSDVIKVDRAKMPLTPISAVMTKDVASINSGDTLLNALNLMTIKGVGRLPVVRKEDKAVIGIITLTDIVRTYDRVYESVLKSENPSPSEG